MTHSLLQITCWLLGHSVQLVIITLHQGLHLATWTPQQSISVITGEMNMVEPGESTHNIRLDDMDVRKQVAEI